METETLVPGIITGVKYYPGQILNYKPLITNF